MSTWQLNVFMDSMVTNAMETFVGGTCMDASHYIHTMQLLFVDQHSPYVHTRVLRILYVSTTIASASAEVNGQTVYISESPFCKKCCDIPCNLIL